MIKLRTFENFSQSPGDISDEELNSKIKEVVSNIVKTRQYFMMLHESAQNVYEMIENGEIEDSKTLAAFMLASSYLPH